MPPWESNLKRIKHWLTHGHVFRFLKIKKYLSSNSSRKVQIAPGELPVKRKGWLTGDLYTGDIYLDAARKLPFPDNSIHYIFSEHFLEHLNFTNAIRNLHETYRILRPNGVVRISLPDLEKVSEIYVKRDEKFLEEFLDLLKRTVPEDERPIFQARKRLLPAEYINASFYAYDHRFMWDFEILTEVLKALGFVNINQFEVGESDNKELRSLERHTEFDRLNKIVSLNVQATKPLEKTLLASEVLPNVKFFLKKKYSKGRV